MPKYATKTDVPVSKSRSEIESIISRYGADEYMYGTKEGQAMVAFKMHGYQIRYLLKLPVATDREFTHTEKGKARTESAATKEWEQACRQRWRVLALGIKAKLEMVECEVTEFVDEFMPNTVMEDGRTVSDSVKPRIIASYETSSPLPLLSFDGEK